MKKITIKRKWNEYTHDIQVNNLVLIKSRDDYFVFFYFTSSINEGNKEKYLIIYNVQQNLSPCYVLYYECYISNDVVI